MYNIIKSNSHKITSTSWALIILLSFIVSCGTKTNASSSFNPTSLSGKKTIEIPISKIDNGNAYFYKYSHDNVDIKFFVLKSSDGIFRAAFDACDVCWRSGKGYKQLGDKMICRNCGRGFASTMVNEIEGGCNPAPLKRRVENGKLTIKISDIVPGSKFFNL
jgi:uncharacterized membrane protein